MNITLADLRAANLARQEEWCPDQKPDLSFRGNELAGEIGETIEAAIQVLVLGTLAGRASNLVKKLERERYGWIGSRATTTDLADELGDIVICCDLVAITAGVNLNDAVVGKFNSTSVKNGLTAKLTPPASTPTHRHKKRGSEYALIGVGRMQAENWEEREYTGTDEAVAGSSVDMREVAIYRSCDDDTLWVRPRDEFEDGRFEDIRSTPHSRSGGMEDEDELSAEMSLTVALDFADNPRPYHTLQAPADTNSELYRALKVIAAAYRASDNTAVREEKSFSLDWIAGPRPPVHPSPMEGRRSFSSLDDALMFFNRQATDARFVSLTEHTTRTIDRSNEFRSAISQQQQGK